ncbi:MAG TPA: RNase H family protein [Blastocatellia bacterium]|nr:RNase H family protein [Blastocatellia bacterium]
MSKFEGKLRARAEEFICAANRAGIAGAIVEDSFRDYMVKISITTEGCEFGNATLYYSPKTNSFSLKTHELKNRSIASQLEECWHEESAETVASAETIAPTTGYEIYVDGSYINGATGYGLVILKDGRAVEELFGQVADTAANGTRQVAGELVAVEEALKWCQKNDVKEVSIFYDYLGIEKWATGAWKANQSLTQSYGKFVRASGIRIRWHKVASHTGNRWNDRADKFAKKGALSVVAQADESKGNVELLDKKDRFLEFLMVKGIDAAFDRIYNDQFARVMILEDEKSVGTFDLYNTKRKPFSPYLHNFKDDVLKSEIKKYWEEFSSDQ